MEWTTTLLFWVKTLVGGVVGICLWKYAIWPLITGLRTLDEPPRSQQSSLQRPLMMDQELEIPTEIPDETGFDRAKIIQKAKEDPVRTTLLVRNWLQEKK